MQDHYHVSSFLVALSEVPRQIQPSPEPPGSSDVQHGLQRMLLGSTRPDVPGWLCVTHLPSSSRKRHFHSPVWPSARTHLLSPSSTLLPKEMPACSLGHTDIAGTGTENWSCPPLPPPCRPEPDHERTLCPAPPPPPKRKAHGKRTHAAGSQAECRTV